MKNSKTLKTKVYNVLGRFDTAFFIFILFTAPKLMSKEGIDFNFVNCFYTDGLFEKHGSSFVTSFLFELPLAVLRWIGQTGMLPLLAVAFVLAVIETKKSKACK